MTQTLFLEEANLSLVKPTKIKDVLKIFGLEIEKDDKSGEEKIYLSREDKINEISAKCSSCGVEMSVGNFGHLAKGSKLIYCRNPVCFNHYIALKKIKEKDS